MLSTDKQTDKQTNRQTNQRYQKHNLLCQGGNYQNELSQILVHVRQPHGLRFSTAAFHFLVSLLCMKCMLPTIVTSLAKEVMFLVALVSLSVCLSVCLFVCRGQHYSKSYERIGMKFYGRVLSSTRKN